MLSFSNTKSLDIIHLFISLFLLVIMFTVAAGIGVLLIVTLGVTVLTVGIVPFSCTVLADWIRG